MITLTGEPLDNLHAFDNLPPKDIHWDALTGPPHHPCNKLKGYPSGPIGALLSRLGLTSPGKDQSTYPEWSAKASLDEISEAFHGHLSEMLHAAESKVVPLMEGVVVRIPPVMDNPSEAQPKHPETLTWESLEGKEGVKHHHHHGHQTQMALSFGGRYVTFTRLELWLITNIVFTVRCTTSPLLNPSLWPSFSAPASAQSSTSSS